MVTMMGVYLSSGNSKLEKTGAAMGRRIVAFNLPADYAFETADGARMNTCPGAQACRGVCYAKQGRFILPSVMRPRLENLKASQGPDFVPELLIALDKSGADTVRIHDSGDFYSQQYLDSWIVITTARPDVTFYAYTKSLHLNFERAPENLRVVQSAGGKHDEKIDDTKPHARIFSTDYQRRKAGYVDGGQTDRAAITGLVQIGLVYHGTKNMTGAQRAYFSA